MVENEENHSLIQKARLGDRQAQGLLVEYWYKRVYNFALKLLGDHDQAMDVSQRTFITMYQKIEKLRECGKFKSWLYTILVNQCREEKRQGGSSRFHLLASPDPDRIKGGVPEEITEALPNPEEKLINGELEKSLKNALQLLPEEQRIILIMKEYEGLKFREIAEALNIPENTAKSRLYYAFQNMRKILTKEAIEYVKYRRS
ncbi:RNA polymerase sigma factor [Negadavirga shengliensis]|uniref:RNA polymerase sigma factor n=1 Tax=Negadavirga shengliensis TaxID=1389218 RepID=A0ABV9SX66_9BACT